MKSKDDLSGGNIELKEETLAVAFSECGRRRNSSDGERRSGRTLFRRFVKENCTSVWKPDLVNSISSVRFGGHLRNPPTLLLQGDSDKLQHIRDAWSNRLLRSPEGYHIDFVGDVTRIGARPLTRGHFIPLADAVCVSIGNLSSRVELATQEAILIELERSFPGVHSPSRELIHETLGKLIRSRNIFCTGPGYHLVTTKTYSGKFSDETDVEETQNNENYKCEACERNRSIFENQAKERRSYRVRNRRDYSYDHPVAESNSIASSVVETSQQDSDSLHGKALPVHDDTRKREIRDKRDSLRKAVEVRQSSSRKSISLVDKMAEKLFRRRKSTERRTSGASNNSSPKNNSSKRSSLSAKQGHVEDARPNGSQTSKNKSTRRRSSHKEERSSSESPVKRLSSSGKGKQRSSTSDFTESTTSRSSMETEKNLRQSIPDTIPERENNETGKSRSSVKDRKSSRTQKTISKSENSKAKNSEKERMPSKNNNTPRRRDVAVSCNLDDTDLEANYDVTESTVQNNKELHNSLQPSTGSRRKETKPIRRSKSLRLPRERHDMSHEKNRAKSPDAYIRPENYQYPDYYSTMKSDAPRGMSYDTIQRNMTTQKFRRSISSASTGREYSYLHACHFAPSVRVGSVIADHLEELERRRHLLDRKSSREMSPASSVTSSSYISNESPDDAQGGQRVVKLKPPAEDESKENLNEQIDSDENQSELDSETQAALKVAKRLAKLDIKMTREEWKEYFSSKTLPEHVEIALMEADQEEEIEDEKNYHTSTCFANTSGSVETVIDVTERTQQSRNSRASSKASSNERNPNIRNCVSEYWGNDSNRFDYADYGSLKGTNPDYDLTNNNHIDQAKAHDMFYRCPDVNTDEEDVFYTCDHGHCHLPYGNQHKQLVAMDSASLTEDSGFHSARERNSFAYRDTTRKPRGTFV